MDRISNGKTRDEPILEFQCRYNSPTFRDVDAITAVFDDNLLGTSMYPIGCPASTGSVSYGDFQKSTNFH